jgi:hypothetical protein
MYTMQCNIEQIQRLIASFEWNRPKEKRSKHQVIPFNCGIIKETHKLRHGLRTNKNEKGPSYSDSTCIGPMKYYDPFIASQSPRGGQYQAV